METAATFRIPEFRLAALDEVIVRANRKAAKLGVSGFSVREVGVEEGVLISTTDPTDGAIIQTLHYGDELVLLNSLDRDPRPGERRLPVNIVTVEVTGTEPVIEGWRFAAAIDHDGEGNIVNQVPGDTVVRVSDWVSAGPDCDHCKLDRRRTKTYLLVEQATGALKQVGSTCIADFLGGHTADQMAKLAETWTVIMAAASDDPDDWGGYGGEAGWMRETVLAQAASIIRQVGFVSKGRVYEQGGVATASRVVDALIWRPSRHEPERPFPPEAEDDELAAAVLAWADDLDPDPSADYLWNLTTALARPVTTSKLMGLVVSAITAYNRDMERDARDAAEAAIEWVKVPFDGERVELTGTVLSTKMVETDFGSQLKMLLRVDTGPGAAFKLWGSVARAIDPEIGDTVRFTAKVDRSRDDDKFGFWSRPTKASVSSQRHEEPRHVALAAGGRPDRLPDDRPRGAHHDGPQVRRGPLVRPHEPTRPHPSQDRAGHPSQRPITQGGSMDRYSDDYPERHFAPYNDAPGEVDDDPDPTRTYWTTGWNYVDGDCGDFPWEFDTEEEARRVGEDWLIETEAEMRAEGDEGEANYWVYRHEIDSYGGRTVYDEDGKRLYAVGPP